MDTKYIAGFIISLLIVGGGSFYGGMTYAQANAPVRTFGGGQFVGRGVRGGGFTAGSIVAKDATSITVQLQDGSTKIILIGSSTQIMKAATGTLNDLAIGTNVAVMGSPNQDGSITAQSVQVRPPRPQGAGTSTPGQ